MVGWLDGGRRWEKVGEGSTSRSREREIERERGREGEAGGGAAPPGPPATQSVSWLVDIHIM